MKRATNFNERSLSRYLGVIVGLALLASSCNFTPGVPLPPPPRQNFELMNSVEDCRGKFMVEVNAIVNTFESGQLALITNLVTRSGSLTPVNSDGSLQALVEVADGERIAIRTKTDDGEESIPVVCVIPPPGNRCVEPL